MAQLSAFLIRIGMPNDSHLLLQQYANFQHSAEQKYGPRTIVLMQIGYFYELFGIEEGLISPVGQVPVDQMPIGQMPIGQMPIGHVSQVAQILGLLAHPSDRTQTVSFKNPMTTGFLMRDLGKYQELLLSSGWTIVTVEEASSPSEPFFRRVRDVIKPDQIYEDEDKEYYLAEDDL